jgi:hypothetical protein
LKRTGYDGDFLTVLRQALWKSDPARPPTQFEHGEYLFQIGRELFEAFSSLRRVESASDAIFRLASSNTIVRA